jgi:SAM-dependent methyltransferase
VEILVNFGEHPIAHHFLTNPSDSEYVHPVILGYCVACGLTQLVDPIPPEKFYTDYNWLSSWKWNPHVPRLVQLVSELSGLRKESRILEVGSNDGSFLEVLRKEGYQKLLGVEPAQDAVEAARKRGVETVRAYFNEQTGRQLVTSFDQCDLFIARQVLEHVTDLQGFRCAMQFVLREGGYALIEVPNFGFSQAASDYSAIWEEHVNHFTLETLHRFFDSAGIEMLHSETATFSGEILIVLGKYSGKPSVATESAPTAELRSRAFAYRDRWPGFCGMLIQFLQEQRKAGRKVAIYGAGCRACCLINYTSIAPHVEFVVDDQAEKQGKYMPGSRLPILPSDALRERSINLCLLAVNAENEEKVIGKHKAYLERGGQFASVHPPSHRLPPFWSRA